MQISSDDLPYLLTLHSVDGLGSVRLMRLLELFGSGKAIWQAKEKEYRGLGIPDKVIVP